MPIYNVAVPVVANVAEESPADAYDRLANALRAAGFEPEDFKASTLMPPFEAEPGTEPDL